MIRSGDGLDERPDWTGRPWRRPSWWCASAARRPSARRCPRAAVSCGAGGHLRGRWSSCGSIPRGRVVSAATLGVRLVTASPRVVSTPPCPPPQDTSLPSAATSCPRYTSHHVVITPALTLELTGRYAPTRASTPTSMRWRVAAGRCREVRDCSLRDLSRRDGQRKNQPYSYFMATSCACAAKDHSTSSSTTARSSPIPTESSPADTTQESAPWPSTRRDDQRACAVRDGKRSRNNQRRGWRQLRAKARHWVACQAVDPSTPSDRSAPAVRPTATPGAALAAGRASAGPLAYRVDHEPRRRARPSSGR